MESAPQKEAKNGQVIVFTGEGKGKTTAALGIALRAAGYGFRSLIVQFVKGSWETGEIFSLPRLAPEVEFHRMGIGFVGILDDKHSREEHIHAAQEALQFSRKKLSSGQYPIVILDEIFVAAQLQLIGLNDLLDLLNLRPPETTLILTGRNAPPEIMERADTVTEMKNIKHAFQKGIPAQRGVDY
jgi:cob(I)alamin adenosyltransferase